MPYVASESPMNDAKAGGRLKRMIELAAVFAMVGILPATLFHRTQSQRTLVRHATFVDFLRIRDCMVFYHEAIGLWPVDECRSETADNPVSTSDRLSWRAEFATMFSGNIASTYPREGPPPSLDELLHSQMQPCFTYQLEAPHDTIAPLPPKIVCVVGDGTVLERARSAERWLPEVSTNGIVAIEIAEAEVPWHLSGDLCADRLSSHLWNSSPFPFGRHDDCFVVIFGDLSVRQLRSDVPFETIRPFFRAASADRLDRDRLLGPYTVRQSEGPSSRSSSVSAR